MDSFSKEILREYEKDRLQADRLYDKRRDFIYEKLPRVKVIDEKLNDTGIEIAKRILEKKSGSDKFIKDRKKRNEKLLAEKDKLLTDAGFDNSYLEDIYKCKKCKDTGFVGNRKCICYKQKLIDRLYNFSGLGNSFEKENFDTFNLDLVSDYEDPETGLSQKANTKRIHTSCLDFVSNFGKVSQNLFFYGDTGLGKTFLCNCIAKEVIEMGYTVLYRIAPQMFRIIEDYKFQKGGADISHNYLDYLFEVDLLIIDDLGTESSSIVTSSELFNIINTRLISGKATIISSNMDLGDFEDQYSSRVISRLYGNYKVFKFFGKDIRIASKYGRNAFI